MLDTLLLTKGSVLWSWEDRELNQFGECWLRCVIIDIMNFRSVVGNVICFHVITNSVTVSKQTVSASKNALHRAEGVSYT